MKRPAFTYNHEMGDQPLLTCDRYAPLPFRFLVAIYEYNTANIFTIRVYKL